MLVCLCVCMQSAPQPIKMQAKGLMHRNLGCSRTKKACILVCLCVRAWQHPYIHTHIHYLHKNKPATRQHPYIHTLHAQAPKNRKPKPPNPLSKVYKKRALGAAGVNFVAIDPFGSSNRVCPGARGGPGARGCLGATHQHLYIHTLHA